MIAEAIAAVASAIGRLLGLVSQKDAQLNQPNIEAGKVVQENQAVFDQITTDAATGDLGAVQKDVAAADLGCVAQVITNGTLALLLMLWLAACTVTPDIPRPSTPSLDGTNLNSGVISVTNGVYTITEGARQRYNGLVGVYGGKFMPPITHDFGVTVQMLTNQPANVYWMTAEAMAKFGVMSQWRREGK